MTLRDYMFIDEMRKLRNNTRFHQLTKEEVSIFSEKQPIAYLHRKQKAWAKRCGDDITCPAILEAVVPEATSNGQTFVARTMQVLNVESPTAVVSVEITSANLEYIRHAILAFGKYT